MEYVIAILTLLFFGIPILISLRKKETPKKYKLTFYDDITETESNFINLLNSQRKSIGAKESLFVDASASFIAFIHTNKMVEDNELSHDNYPMRQRVLIDNGALAVGEIVNRNTNIKNLFERFMQSDEHRRTMLNPKYNACGISIINNNGALYCTVLFIKTI